MSSVDEFQNSHPSALYVGSASRALLLDVLLSNNGTWLKRQLSDYLSTKDAMQMSFVCTETRLLRSVAIPNDDLASRSMFQRGPHDFYGASKWFTLPIHLPSVDIHTVIVRGSWNDQGWGNRKGMLSIVANADGRAPGDHQAPSSDVVACISPAPHRKEQFQLSFHPLEDHHNDNDNEEYTLWTRVGGGGGHALSVQDLSLMLFVYEDACSS
mmetsp:Transcript_9350/g.13855  ORF Transcript_9350/g.13855 Transcript_9350/m.13855 type:complete len:212 (-) Transcript_9350:77-712(-)